MNDDHRKLTRGTYIVQVLAVAVFVFSVVMILRILWGSR